MCCTKCVMHKMWCVMWNMGSTKGECDIEHVLKGKLGINTNVFQWPMLKGHLTISKYSSSIPLSGFRKLWTIEEGSKISFYDCVQKICCSQFPNKICYCHPVFTFIIQGYVTYLRFIRWKFLIRYIYSLSNRSFFLNREYPIFWPLYWNSKPIESMAMVYLKIRGFYMS